jgi:peroxisomal 2,4-dienoyl-CoA reductase
VLNISIIMSFKPSTVQVIKPVTPTTATFRDDIFKGKVVLSTGGRSGIVYKMIRVMMTHGADSVIMGRK